MEPIETTTARIPQHQAIKNEFAMRFTFTPRGARLTRRLVSHRLDQWGHAYDSAANETLTLIAAELAANAVRHGHVRGRDFHLQLTTAADTLRVEVTDTRAERVPPSSPQEPPGDAESGRGLLLVARLATRWGSVPRLDAPGKMVWAELAPAMRKCDVGAVPDSVPRRIANNVAGAHPELQSSVSRPTRRLRQEGAT
ncbi:ATP-binding protein [Streptomyces albidoflavus]|uniref:ATP-binding protein n=1 Tax=Streptomyces TaxID=1883 RepID=UPI002036C645|nr:MULTISPECIES: ATP-binding protein [unclassified Streptomyces]WSB17735.1 ATP-binding protein [Streptomyces albidoflavus]